MKRILVIWADPDSPNFGVRALATGLRDGLSDVAELTFASHRSPLTSGPLSLKRVLLGIILPTSAVLREIASYDAVIDVGEGDSFASIYGWKRFGKVLSTKVLAHRSGRTLVLAPQTLGPWQGWLATRAARFVLGRAQGVWARDSRSLERARRAGVTNVSLASDLVFAIEEGSSDSGPNRAAGDVLLNVSGLLWNHNDHVDSESYRQLITSTIEAVQRDGRRVRLLVHVSSPGTRDDDGVVADELSRRYSLTVVAPDSLVEMRAAITEAGLVVGSRMHACLNAISLGVPTLPLAYSDKFAPLFEDLGYKHVRDLRIPRTVEAADIVSMVEDARMREDARKARLRGRELVGRFISAMRTL